jgi:hypothetical protein
MRFGTWSSGIGRAEKRARHGFASQRAQRVDRAIRALSVAIPVSAYIWRYIFEINMKVRRPRMDFRKRERFQMNPSE